MIFCLDIWHSPNAEVAYVPLGYYVLRIRGGRLESIFVFRIASLFSF